MDHSSKYHRLLQRSFFYATVLVILFPYVQLLPINTDSQPNFLILTLILGPFFLSAKRAHLISLFLICLVIVIFSVSNPTYESARAAAAYLTPPLMLIFTKKMLADRKIEPVIDIFLLVSFVVWVTFGVLQLVTGSVLIETGIRASTTEGRGWMSFAGEPSAFATILFLFAAYFSAINSRLVPIFAFLSVVFVAQSFIGLLYFSILMIAYLLFAVRFRIAFMFYCFLFLIVLLISLNLDNISEIAPDGNRIVMLLNLLASGSLSQDASTSGRVGDLLLVLEPLKTGMIFGGGFQEIRLQSGWGAYVFELGIVGVFIASSWIFYILKSAGLKDRRRFASIFAILVMLFSSTPLSMPFASFVIFLLIFRSGLNDDGVLNSRAVRD